MDISSAITRTLQGDTRAYAEVVRTYQHMVYTVCHRVLRNTAEAEEAAQDTFVKAYRNLRGWNGTSKFSTWLYSIAFRTAVSQGRKRKGPALCTDELTDHPVAEPAKDATELRRHLDRALAALPPEDAAILSFFYLEELSVEEIVTVTGHSASNVKVKLHRGRKKLLDVLQAELKDEARTLLWDHA